MHNQIIKVLFLLFGISTLCSCSEESDPNIHINVEEEFAISIVENLNTYARTLEFVIETVKNDFECSNYTVDFAISKINDDIDLNIRDVLPPLDCISGVSTATSTANSGYLIPKSYKVNIDLKDAVQNKGTLIVEEDSYELMMESTDGLLIGSTLLNKIPTKSIWGYIGYHDIAAQSAIPDFIADLDEIAFPLSLNKGYYGHFDIKENNEMSVYSKPTYLSGRQFIYHYEDDKTALLDLVETYRSTYGEFISVAIFTSEGEMY